MPRPKLPPLPERRERKPRSYRFDPDVADRLDRVLADYRKRRPRTTETELVQQALVEWLHRIDS